ncbi:MAG: orotidine-5'-phosphate decarboxylase [Betaproteobacteria bacterium]|nr:MAG: orotidine-5'-phosphate decarboxylase [Betaproteobacteria bacterium]
MTAAEPRVIVALDFPDMMSAFGLAARLDPSACAVKVGKELFTVAEAGLVRELVRRGFRVFLDLKFHDIPNTVAQACIAATHLGVWMVDVHAAGGGAMMKAAREAVAAAAKDESKPRPLLVAVTVLTSLTAEDLAATGVTGTPEAQVLRLARLAQANGLDGAVCSAQEAAALRAACGPQFKLVTPGIRPAGSAAHDQARVMTPHAAIAAGADYLVIGRAITAAADPLRALREINAALGASH